jgi:hypothetical protein
MGMSGTDDELENRVTVRAREGWNASTDALARVEITPVDADAVLARVLASVDAPANDAAPAPARPRWIAAAAVGLAAAAAIVIAVWPRGSGPGLPAYVEDAFEGGLKTVRKDPAPVPTDAVVHLLPTSSVRWVFAPMQATTLAVDLRIAVTGDTTKCLAPTKGLKVVESGAIELSGAAGDVLPLPAGTYTITALVGTRSDMHDAEDPCRVEANGSRPAGITAVASRLIEMREPS